MKAGWKTHQLGEVCSLVNRGISPVYLETGGICVLNQKCIRDHRISYEPSRRHDLQAKKVADDRLLQAGDVLVNSTGTGTLGRVAQLRNDPPEPTIVDSHVTIVRPKPGKFYPDFFGYMLLVIEDSIKEAGEGCGGQTELARSVLAERFSVHYPESIPEQQRIVAFLDETFDGLATAKANAEKNLQMAHEVFNSHLHTMFEERGDGWEEKPLVELCLPKRIITYGVVKLGDEVTDGIPCLRTSNVRWLRIEIDGMKRISPKLSKDYSRTILQGGEVLVNVRGTLGGVAVVPNDMAGWNVSREVAVVPVDPTRINPTFLSLLIGSGTSQQWLGGKKKGAAYVGINIEDLRLLPVSAPEMAAQLEVVRHLEAVQAETLSLESIYLQKVAALDELKQSILHRAFNGGL